MDKINVELINKLDRFFNKRAVNFAVFLLIFTLICILSPFFAPAAQAATFTVNTLTNENDGPGGCSLGSYCSLIEAVTDANAAGAGSHSINFSVIGTITPGVSLTISNASVTIDGPVNGSGDPTLTVVGPGTGGVFIVTASNVTLENLNVNAANNNGIQTGGSTTTELTVNNVDITNATNGIQITSNASEVTISGCTITSPSAVGIMIASAVGSNTVSGNTVSSAGTYGIVVSATNGNDDNNIINNTITSPGQSGIVLDAYGSGDNTGQTVTGNVITGISSGTNYAGIWVGASSASIISKNTISGAGSDSSGIVVNAADNNVIGDAVNGGNEITGDFGWGIKYKGADGSVDKNTISGPAYGIWLDSEESNLISISHNEILDCTDTGAYLGSEVTTFDGNTISGSTNYGVALEDPATITTFSNNSISTSGVYGLYLQENSSIETASGNTYTGNGSNSQVDRYYSTFNPIGYDGTNYSGIVWYLNSSYTINGGGGNSSTTIRNTIANGTNNFDMAVSFLNGTYLATLYFEDGTVSNCDNVDSYFSNMGWTSVCAYYEADVWQATGAGEDYTWNLSGATLADNDLYVDSPTLSATATEYTGAGVYIYTGSANAAFEDETFVDNDNSIMLGGGDDITSLSFTCIINTTPRGFDYMCTGGGGDWSITNMDLTADNNLNTCEGDLTVYQKTVAHVTSGGNNLSGATVTFNDAEDNEEASKTTDGDGNTDVVTLPVYIQNSGGTSSFNDYSLHISLAGYASGSPTETITLSHTNLTLEETLSSLGRRHAVYDNPNPNSDVPVGSSTPSSSYSSPSSGSSVVENEGENLEQDIPITEEDTAPSVSRGSCIINDQYSNLIDDDLEEFKIETTDSQKLAINSFVSCGNSAATIAFGAGERRALMRDYFETVGHGDVVWTDIERLATGQKPVKRNLTKEQARVDKVLRNFVAIFGHSPNFKNAKDDLAWNTMMYRIRFTRDLVKEKTGIILFKNKIGANPTTPLGWAMVRALGYIE